MHEDNSILSNTINENINILHVFTTFYFILKGGYYSQQVSDNIRLLALNTNLYYRSNHVTKEMSDPAGQLEWLKHQLNDSRHAKQKVGCLLFRTFEIKNDLNLHNL